MAVLRNRKNTKITFNDDGEADAEVVEVATREPTQEPESDSGSDSDEAPEEESTSTAKEDTLAKARKEQELQREAMKLEKEKRKQRDLQFKQQQEAKREKERRALLEKEKKLQREREDALARAQELPDLLPQELLNAEKGKHIRTEEFEAEHADARKRLKLQKLRELKKKSTVRKGPIYVQVQEFGVGKTRVPRAEQTVLDAKSQWLQRESLNRKA